MGRYETSRIAMAKEIVMLNQAGLLDQLGGSIASRLPDGNILITPTTASFRRWNIQLSELVVATPDGELVESDGYKAAAAAPIFLTLFRQYPAIGAIAHSHCLYSLIYASCGLNIPPCTNGADVIGEVVCIHPEERDQVVKERALRLPSPHIPSAFVQRPEIFAVNAALADIIVHRMAERIHELERHGLAFTIFRHGLFTMGRHLQEACENIFRIERSAQVSILARQAGLSVAV
jgi:ribulose-5-phosphate 4-epimerase/fuculose-1-phosphate aldolase